MFICVNRLAWDWINLPAPVILSATPCHQHPHTDQTHTANILQTSVAFIVK